MSRFAALLCVFALALPLRAEEGNKDTLDEARQHAAKAKVHYDLGEFEQAANEYIIVYRLRPIPALLYNVAQAYRQAGQYEKAKKFYKSFLREKPDPKMKVAVEKALKEIDQLLAAEKKTKEMPPTGPTETVATQGNKTLPAPAQGAATPGAATPPAAVEPARANEGAPKPPTLSVVGPPAGTVAPPATSPAQKPYLGTQAPLPSGKSFSSTQRTWSYALTGTSVALLGGGLVFAMKAKNYNDELLAGPHNAATISDLQSTASSASTMSAVLLGAGIAAAAGAGFLYFIPLSSGAGVGGNF
jgi:tetratricopeptide (TPR) repeat protein